MPHASLQSPRNHNAARVVPPSFVCYCINKKGPVSGTDHGAF